MAREKVKLPPCGTYVGTGIYAIRFCLLNVDFDRPHACFLHQGETVAPIDLRAGEFRVIAAV